MAEYPPLLKEYETRLEARVERGEIKRDTMDTYLRDANRLLESLVWLLDEQALARIANARGFGGDYGTVVRDLKEIVSRRSR
ncbi:MAG: hypothetical protein ACM3ZO_10395 [Clostridia bacterium]